MSNNKLIPQLRFPEFKNEGEWEEKKLGEMAELTSSKRVHLADYVSSGVPFFRGKEISQLKNNQFPDDILYISNEQYKEIKDKYGVPKKGDILITAVGTLGNVYCIKNDNEFYFKDGNLIWIKNISIDSHFLEVLLDVEKEKVLASAIGSSQKALTMAALNKIEFQIPQTPQEQQKISSCLSSLDEVIAAHSQKLDLLKDHKKGLMQNLCPQEGETVPKVRFKEFEKDGEWVEKKLGEVCKMQAGKFVNASEINNQFTENLYPCYGGNGLRGYTSSFTHSGTYSLIGRQGALCGNITLAEGKFHATEHAVVVTPESNIDTIWLYYELELLNLNQYATGQAQPGLSVSNLEQVKLFIPPTLQEQQKIASCLSSLDALITAEAEKIAQLKQHKKGLMQQLFPSMSE